MAKNPPRKERINDLYGTTAGNVTSIAVTVDRTGEVHFGPSMINTYSEVSYQRPKGPKILSRIPQNALAMTFDSSAALSKNFDFLCAVDTNTRTINDQKVSVVCAVRFQRAPPPQGAGEYWAIDVELCLEFVGLRPEKPENFGWLVALAELKRRKFITAASRVGIVVDSDLGNINDYNARQKPFFENRLLPAGVKLIYASADAGGEIFLNRVFRVADSVSRQVLDAISVGVVAPNLERIDSPYFDGLRIVQRR